MINLELTNKVSYNKDLIESPDLTDRFTSDDLDRIGDFCFQGYDRDLQSRMVWERRMQFAMNMAMQVATAKTFPWPGSSNVIFPLLTIAALQFSANAYTNIIQGSDVYRYRVLGPDKDGTMTARALRIGAHMSWQVLEEDESWEDEHDRLLIYLSIVGSAFTKTYFSGKRKCPVSDFVTAQDLVVNYWTKSLATAARITQIIQLSRNDIYEGIMQKSFRDVRDSEWYQSVPPTYLNGQTQAGEDKRHGMYPQQADEVTPFMCCEQHRNIDLDEDGYDEPYVITFERASRKILRIVARVESESAVERNSAGRIISINPTQYFTKYGFIPSPDGGFYESGFGVFLGPINEAVDAGINQLIDAGTVQNSNGGFLGRGVKMRGGTYTIAPFEWKRIDSIGDDIRKNMVPFPKSEPSQVTLELLQLLISYARIVAGTQEGVTGENPGQNTPASTYQGMTERGLQIYKMIFKRVWKAMKGEGKLRYDLNKTHMRLVSHYGDDNNVVFAEDYADSSDRLAPVADPNTPSTSLRLAQAGALKQAAMSTNGYDLEVVERTYLRALQIENIDQVYPGVKSGKVQPLPNAKLMDAQIKGSKVQLDKMKLSGDLQQKAKLIDAQVLKLKAEAAKLIKEAGNVGAAEKIQVFQTAINAMESHRDFMNQQAQQMSGDQDGKGSNASPGDSDGGSPPGLASPPGDEGAEGGSGEVADGADGAVGG